MNTPDLIEVYRRIASGEERHGDFLTHFAQSFIRADDTNLPLLAPLALCLAKKYNLSLGVQEELLSDQGLEGLCTRLTVAMGALGVVMLIVHERGCEVVAGRSENILNLPDLVQRLANELKDGKGDAARQRWSDSHSIMNTQTRFFPRTRASVEAGVIATLPAVSPVSARTASKQNKTPCEGDGIRRDRNGLTRCRVCGCTQVDACPEGCGWAQGHEDLCTTCAAAAEAFAIWLLAARRPNRAALWREAVRQTLL